MRNVTCICDGCGDAILENASVLAVTSGPLRLKHDQPIDLCPTCQDRFDEWLRSKHQSDQGEAWNALQTKTASSAEVTPC